MFEKQKDPFEGVWIGDLPEDEQVRRMAEFEKSLDEIFKRNYCSEGYGWYEIPKRASA